MIHRNSCLFVYLWHKVDSYWIPTFSSGMPTVSSVWCWVRLRRADCSLTALYLNIYHLLLLLESFKTISFKGGGTNLFSVSYSLPEACKPLKEGTISILSLYPQITALSTSHVSVPQTIKQFSHLPKHLPILFIHAFNKHPMSVYYG